jgi:hypothetical protein
MTISSFPPIFIFSFLRLQAMRVYYTPLETHIFERMTQVASTRKSFPSDGTEEPRKVSPSC